MTDREHSFTNTLINWYSIVKRDLPWRSTNDPYKIWLSEIILQQTRVDQGLPYYNRFVEAFPSVQDLAVADILQVLKLWEGLGYYSRARNLHKAAQMVQNDYQGKFPDSCEQLLKLPGVGPYTAAAIASIAFGEASPVIDGNVFRFISRYFGVMHDIAEPKNRKYFLEILLTLIPETNPGTFNQAMMEYGATVCKPAADCGACVFRQECYAYAHTLQQKLPVKSKKIQVKDQYFTYLVFEHADSTLMRMRTDSIWTGLYEFYAVIADHPIKSEEMLPALSPDTDMEILEHHAPVRHLLSHRRLWVSFIHVNVSTKERFERLAKELELTPYTWEEVLTLPRPKVIVNHLQQVVF